MIDDRLNSGKDASGLTETRLEVTDGSFFAAVAETAAMEIDKEEIRQAAAVTTKKKISNVSGREIEGCRR